MLSRTLPSNRNTSCCTTARSRRTLRLADRVDNRPDRLKEHYGVDLKGEDVADLGLVAQEQPPAEPDDQQARRGDHEAPHGPQRQLDPLGVERLADGGVMPGGVGAFLARLATKSADDADPAERLDHARVDLRAVLPDRPPHRTRLAH